MKSLNIRSKSKTPPKTEFLILSIFMTPLELILSEIPEKSNARRPVGGGQENPSAHGQKISSPETPPFLPARF